MKKNFIYLLLLFNLIAQAQITPSYPTIKLTKTIEGVKHDSLLVVATDKTVKHIPSSKITSIIEYTTASALPITGVAGKIYVTKDNGKIYRWNDTYYTELAITDISGKVDKIVGKSLLSDTEITRLATLSNYTHPTNHPPSVITQDASNRFVTDVEKTAWNAKQGALGFTPENVSNKQNSLAVDGTGAKFVTVDAINSVIVNETTGVFSNIQTLVNSAQLGTTINLKPNAIYAQDNSLVLKEGITINGNGATLKRNAQQTTTTTVSATEVSTSITVSSVPVGWKTGDYLQLYTNDTYLTSSRKYEVIISSIAGNVITLSQPIGAPASGSTYTWAIGTTVRKVFSQITSQRSTDLFTTPTNWTVNNLILDGNKSNNVGNFYWGVNMTVQNNGRSELHNVTFKDIPNECVFGSGFTIKNSTLTNSNGSFLHQSADVTVGNSIFGGEITGNTTINTNIKDGVNVTGHSEAVITFSFSSGRTKISNNRFLGGSGSVMGRVVNSYTLIDGSLKDFIFTNNYCEAFSSIFDSFAYSASGLVTNVDNVLISNNTFNNCGVNDFGIYSSQINSFGKIKIYDNILNGTTTILNEPWKLSFDKTIRKDFVTQGTTASPNYDKIVAGGIKDSNEAGIYFGNSFGENQGTFIKLSTNPTGASSAPNDALIIKPNGDADFIGKITASPATLSNHVVVKSQLDAVVARPYKVYTAVLTQQNTDAPSAVVLENTLGGTVVWTRNATGNYYGTLNSAFPIQNKIALFQGGSMWGMLPLKIIRVQYLDSNTIQIITQQATDGALVDSSLANTSIEIRVYL